MDGLFEMGVADVGRNGAYYSSHAVLDSRIDVVLEKANFVLNLLQDCFDLVYFELLDLVVLEDHR